MSTFSSVKYDPAAARTEIDTRAIIKRDPPASKRIALDDTRAFRF